MADSLAEASAVGAAESDLAAGIRRRLDSAQAWEKRAADFFAAPGKAPSSALEVSLTIAITLIGTACEDINIIPLNLQIL